MLNWNNKLGKCILALIILSTLSNAVGCARGPAVELALKASDLGPGWKGAKLYSYYDGRRIDQQFRKTIQVDDNIRLDMMAYQHIVVYPNSEAAIENSNLRGARERSPEPTPTRRWTTTDVPPLLPSRRRGRTGGREGGTDQAASGNA